MLYSGEARKSHILSCQWVPVSGFLCVYLGLLATLYSMNALREVSNVSHFL